MKKGNFTTGKNLKWIHRQKAINQNRIALIIPQYNEPVSSYFEERLNYYNYLAKSYQSFLDVILVDDGSTNGSLKLIEHYVINNNTYLSAAAIDYNTNKVGALALTVNAINNDFIFFSDFDTDLIGLDILPTICDKLSIDPNLMGCYFKMKPFDSSNIISTYQTIEYSLLRTWYSFHYSDKSANVMPGAGSLFKNSIIREIFLSHSGYRNGEDRESTVIGQRLGYHSVYENRILILTRTPTNISDLVNQRIRWNLGYLETIYFEKEYFLSNLKKRNRFGVRVILDFVNVLMLIIISLFALIIPFINFRLSFIIIISVLFIKYVWIFALTFKSNRIVYWISKTLPVLLIYPFLKVIIEIPSCGLATIKFCKFWLHKIKEVRVKKKSFNKPGPIF